jgi:drug/metabolite transporter (DMT)-like permease
MPLFLTALARPLLGEHVGRSRWAAVLVGFAGVSLVIRPWEASTAGAPLGALLLVLAGVLGGTLAMISIRSMGQAGESNLTIVAWFSLGSALLSGLLVVPVWVRPTPTQLGCLLAIGLISGLAQMLMTEGYRTCETHLLAPFEYGGIIYATVLGAVLWGQWPGTWEAAGITVLIASGLHIWRQETGASAAGAR